MAERYGFINVPSAVWIDEDDRIVRPPDITPVNDLFKDFTGIDSELHHVALRAWVRDGIVPMPESDVAQLQSEPSEADESARLYRRVAAHLHRSGDDAGAARHFDQARQLAPWDWTIQRGSMPLSGRDPFGQEFFDFVERWSANGAPGYRFGNSVMRRAAPPT